LPFGCTNAPPPRAATLFHQGFEDRQSMRHCYPYNLLGGNMSLDSRAGSNIRENLLKTDDAGTVCFAKRKHNLNLKVMEYNLRLRWPWKVVAI
jgi:hypothetical protein